MAQENLKVIYQNNKNNKNKKDTSKINNILIDLQSYGLPNLDNEDQQHSGGKKKQHKKKKTKN